jgi:hypothetical protein
VLKLTLVPLLLLLTLNGIAGTITYSANTDGGPLWNRPEEGIPPTALGISPLGGSVPYHVQQFTVATAANYTFYSLATPDSWDNFIFLYELSFDPTQPLQHVLAGDDDLVPGVPGESQFNYNLSAGTQYFMVTTGWLDYSRGPFTNTISTTANGDIQLTPEPGTLTLLVAGIALVSLRRRALARR